MYRRLEPKTIKLKALEKKSEDICVCNCKAPQSAEEPQGAEANLLGTKLSVDYDLNG